MRTLLAAAAALLVSLGLYAPAHAGASLKAPDCAGQFAPNPAIAPAAFRSALLCVVNDARRQQGLPPYKASKPLDRAAQRHANDQAKRGYANHTSPGGSTMASRIRGAGYHFSAYNEALGIGDSDFTSAYDLVRDLVRRAGHPCSAIFDPRFRDLGIGMKVGRAPGAPAFEVTYLVLDFGLRTGARPASSRAKPASSCPHKLPAPPFSGSPVVPESAPVAGTDAITQTLRCTARATCAFTTTVFLKNAKASSEPAEVSIPAGRTKEVRFPVSADALERELSAARPALTLNLELTAPEVFHDEFEGPLTRG